MQNGNRGVCKGIMGNQQTGKGQMGRNGVCVGRGCSKMSQPCVWGSQIQRKKVNRGQEKEGREPVWCVCVVWGNWNQNQTAPGGEGFGGEGGEGGNEVKGMVQAGEESRCFI